MLSYGISSHYCCSQTAADLHILLLLLLLLPLCVCALTLIKQADNCSANAKCDACVTDNDPQFAALNGVCDANKNEDVLRAQFPKDCLTIPQIDKGVYTAVSSL
jgi:hypothetical protein